MNKFLSRYEQNNLFFLNACVQAKFFYSYKLVFFFFKVFPDFLEQHTAIAFTFTSDALHIFWVDAKPCLLHFHTLSMPLVWGCHTLAVFDLVKA